MLQFGSAHMNKSSKFKILAVFNLILSIVCICLSAFCFSEIYFDSSLTAEQIFHKNYKSIVESKCSSVNGDSYGTGILVKEGAILTNYHVCSYTLLGEDYNYEEISYRFSSDSEYFTASVMASDSDLDLALLTIDREGLTNFVNIDISDLQYGEKCFSIGNANNLGISISEGIISIPSISITYDNISQTYIQSNTDIYPGSSGGGLFNDKGNLIGITSFRLNDSSSDPIYSYGYSIPAERVEEFIESQIS